MDFSKRVPSPNIGDKTVLGGRERNLTNPPILLPMTESEFLRRRTTDTVHACASGPMPTHEVAPAVEANSDIQRLEHIATGPHVSTIPGDETSMPSSNSSKKNPLFSGKGIVFCALLALATGIAVGADWSWTHSLTENWKSNNLRGVLETIFADSSKGEQSAQAALAAADVTAPDVSEIQNQLNVIASGLSSVQQSINELAAGQQQIRKAQEQLAEAQSQLAASLAQANAKQNKQPVPATTETRKFYRRD